MREPEGFYIPVLRNSGSVVVNTEALARFGLEKPQSYQDLLKEEYRPLLTMPNPKSSGTGYMFLKGLVNAWGEEDAFAYFDAFAQNVLMFPSSGSGSINTLVQGEAAVALGMTAQAVREINQGAPLEILSFPEGNPYSLCGMAMITGREKDTEVKEVFDFFVSELIPLNNTVFFPEPLLSVLPSVNSISNYPTDLVYMDMSGDTIAEKERLLEQWEY